MVAQNVTIMTRLEKTKEFLSYFEPYITEYNQVYREMWYHMTASEYTKKYAKASVFVTEMCQKQQMLKRTINAIRYDIKGRIQALQALKETEWKQLELKIAKKEEKIAKLEEWINQRKPLVRENRVSKQQLLQYRNKKQSLYYQKNRLNQMKQKYAKLQYQIQQKQYSLGFGGKHMFDKQHHLKENGYATHTKWYHEYKKARDKNIFYLGSADETAGNQLFQLVYQPMTDTFDVKIRKEKKYCFSEKENYIFLHNIRFGYLQKELVAVWKAGKQPLSFRIHRTKNKWYLQCIFAIQYEESAYRTSTKYGTLGLDYNDGFLEMSETDCCGNLIGQSHYDLPYHGTGKKAENEIRQVVSKIVKLAEEKGKTIIIENLDFKKTKAKITKANGKKGKQYHKMLHLFDYRRYKDTIRNSCHRHKVQLQLVNPKNTSKIGIQKYSWKKKLNPHQAASFVLARMGQGFQDSITI